MRAKLFSLVLAIVTMSASSVFAQNFFWSTVGFENGAVNGNFVINTNFAPATGDVYLYYSPNGQNITVGFDLDFSWTDDDVVAFTAAETFEADITLGVDGPDLNDRWGAQFGPAGEVTPNAVSTFAAINIVDGTGIQVGNIPGVLENGIDFVDTLYDTTAEAFLIGSISYEILDPGITSLRVSGLVVDNADIGASFSSLEFFAPEPSSAGILALGLVGFVARRRRSS